jgi:hypothetical protein
MEAAFPNLSGSAQMIIDSPCQAVQGYCDGDKLQDDVTVVAIKFLE